MPDQWISQSSLKSPTIAHTGYDQRYIMAATKENPVIFYDLASSNNLPWSPSTYKIRLSLIFKQLPFRVQYISYPDIEPTFKELGVPQGNPLGRYKYTVPAIADPSTEPGGKPTYIADSWTIALYLERTYPPPLYPALFPHHSIALHHTMALQLDRTVEEHLANIAVPLVALERVLDDRGHEHFVKTREAIYKRPLAEVLERADGVWTTNVRNSWSSLADNLDMNGPMAEVGPYVMGKSMSYSDFYIAGIILWLRRGEGVNGWRCKELLAWDEGRWGLLWGEVEKLETKSTEI
ncbi:glutathione S-transferase [Ceratobasidium sp. AG-Ba]|nr:glutathione S-transferase [Ceratobasidium sp. AG-Ba]